MTRPPGFEPDPTRRTDLSAKEIKRARYVAGRIAGLSITEAMRRAGYAEITSSNSPIRRRMARDPDLIRDIEEGIKRSLAAIAPEAPMPAASLPHTAPKPAPVSSDPDDPLPAQRRPVPVRFPPGWGDDLQCTDQRNKILRYGHDAHKVDLTITPRTPIPMPMPPVYRRNRIDTRGRIMVKAYGVRRVTL